jgi:hypothetical protein
MIPTPAIVMLYSASLGSPGGGLDANMKACVAIYPASGVFGMMLLPAMDHIEALLMCCLEPLQGPVYLQLVKAWTI